MTRLLFLLFILGLPGGRLSAQDRKAVPLAAVNSTYDELMPVLSQDGQTLYLVRAQHPDNVGGEGAGQDIWFSRRSAAGTWSEPRNLGEPLNNAYNNAVVGTSPDDTQLWLSNRYLRRNASAPGLSVSPRTAKGWGFPTEVPLAQFQPRTGSVSFCVATSEVLLLAMETDTARQEDLFISRKQGNGTWGPPQNLGTILNTNGFEIAPFLAPDLRTLYFTSNGHPGFGDADIFMSYRLDDTWLNWSAPVNLGPEVNSSGFDAYFFLDATGDYAYFTSEDGVQDDTDIYVIRQRDIRARIPVSVTAREPAPNQENAPVPAAAPSKAGARVYFAIDSSQLSAEARRELEAVVQALQDQPGARLLIAGHADETGSKGYNQRLSEKRAQAVAEYLEQQGIRRDRLRLSGYGSQQPLSPGGAMDEQARNRRVEISIQR